MRSKTCTRSHNNTGFFHQFHAECHTVCTSSRDSCPYEHRSLAIRKVPSDFTKAITECISSFLIHSALLLHTFQWAIQCCDRCLLNWQKHSKIDLASQLAKCRDHIWTPNQKTDSCSCHIEGFRKAEKFHADFFRSFCCKETSAMCSVKDDITICVVMNDQNIIFLRKGNDFFI